MSVSPIVNNEITAVILAGGRARRMGGEDKGLIKLNGRPMLEYIIEALQSQAGRLIINANRNISRYREYGIPVVQDETADFQGPLAGIASAMRISTGSYLLTVPCDSPYLPQDLGNRLGTALIDHAADISVANNGERLQPVFALLKTALLDSLENYLQRGERKIDLWYKQHRIIEVDFSDNPEAFLNINTPEDILMMESRPGTTA
ncbi:MAG: molybdenum cofactor guanylyltransferase [Thiotrichales bacterium]|nr:molybdenum cofactor guanylyltransferase [Thiotrichales bacterium]